MTRLAVTVAKTREASSLVGLGAATPELPGRQIRHVIILSSETTGNGSKTFRYTEGQQARELLDNPRFPEVLRSLRERRANARSIPEVTGSNPVPATKFRLGSLGI